MTLDQFIKMQPGTVIRHDQYPDSLFHVVGNRSPYSISVIADNSRYRNITSFARYDQTHVVYPSRVQLPDGI